jgi:hypothetical protein
MEIWIFDRTREALARLTFEEHAMCPVWSPSGDTLYYSGGAESTGRDI